MKLRKLAVAASLAAIGLSAAFTTPAFAAEEQFFPLLVYRTGAYAPNGTPWANGFLDYLKLTNARGGVNGVKMIWEECETGYATDRGVDATSASRASMAARPRCSPCLPASPSP
jgi:branched-chain amino acid transport system substrate-binding protein